MLWGETRPVSLGGAGNGMGSVQCQLSLRLFVAVEHTATKELPLPAAVPQTEFAQDFDWPTLDFVCSPGRG